MSLLIAGTVAFDSIETPFGKVEKTVGGAATYISLAASYFTNNLGIVSIVGSDFPENFLEFLKNKSIDIEGLQIISDAKTFFWEGVYHNDMNTRDTLKTELNVLSEFDPKVPEKFQDADFLMLGNLDPKIQLSVLNQMKKRPKLIALDTMNFWINNSWDDLMKVISQIDLLTINDEEARQLTNEYSLVKAARKIQTMGPDFLVIKKGENGALLFHNNEAFFAPALPLEEVLDPTGAGDTFAGGFMGYITQTNDISFDNMKRAVIYGSAMASFCVEKFGIEKIMEISNNDLENKVNEFINLVQFDIILSNNQQSL